MNNQEFFNNIITNKNEMTRFIKSCQIINNEKYVVVYGSYTDIASNVADINPQCLSTKHLSDLLKWLSHNEIKQLQLITLSW